MSIKNPIFLFVSFWLFVLFIYSKHYSLLLTVLNLKTVAYIVSICLSFIFSYFMIRLLLLDKKFVKVNSYSENPNTFSKLKVVFKIWLFFTIIEVLYFRGLPLLAILGLGGGIGRYTEWGIPSLHGFLNAMIITLSNYFFFYFLKNKRKKDLYLFLLCILWPIMLITRQMFLTMIVQATIIYILTNTIKISSIIKVVLAVCLVVVIFGIIGDLRSDADLFIQLVQPSHDYPTWLPSGVLWVYVYMVSPLNNVNYNIYNYSDFEFNLSPLISNFFPSFIRSKIFSSSGDSKFQLVNENLNVSTMFPNYLDAFGYYGSVFFFFFLGLIVSYIYIKYKSRKSNIVWLFILVIIIHNFIFSVFVDFFFNLVFLFQMVLHFIISNKTKKVEC